MLTSVFSVTQAQRSPITIIANPGSFPGIAEAASGEEKVNWQDNNLSDDRACTESFAAMELMRYLSAGGIFLKEDIILSPGEKIPRSGHLFILGSRASNPLIEQYIKEVPSGLQSNESYHLLSLKEGDRIITIIEGKERVGVLYGVYAYLERVGFHFFGPGEQGTVYPDQTPELATQLNMVENPDFLTRGFWAWERRGNREFFLWMARNRMNYWTANEEGLPFLKKLGIKLTDGGHVIQNLCLDPLTYFETHPEWYGMYDGKRQPSEKTDFGKNYCTSNEDATAELAKNLVQHLIDGEWRDVDILNFWMKDGGQWCECEACASQGTHTDRLFVVLDRVLKEIDKAHAEGRLKREVRIDGIAYYETLTPPEKPLPEDFNYTHFSMTFFPITRCYVHALNNPLCTEINQRIYNNLLGWTTGTKRHYQGAVTIGEYYNISYLKSLPVLFTQNMSEDIPFYHQSGIRHFHYMHAPTSLWGTWTLNQHLMGKLLWNAQTDTDSLLNGYFKNYYPSTNEIAREFYHHLESGLINIKYLKKWGWLNQLVQDSIDLFNTGHFHYEIHHPDSNDAPDMIEMKHSMQLARQYIDEAIFKCSDDTEMMRLLEDEKRFAYGEAMVDFYYHIVRTAIFHRRNDTRAAKNSFAYLEQTAERLKEFVDIVQVSSSHANAENGLDAVQLSPDNNAYLYFEKMYR